MKKFITLILLLVCCLLSSCKKEGNINIVTFDYQNETVVKINQTYYFPILLDKGNGKMDFEILKSPEKSSLVKIGDKDYIKWKPTKTGDYTITIGKDFFQQSYSIKVK